MRNSGSDIWYEWSSFASVRPYEDEMYGILCGLPETITTEGSMFQTDRLFAYRRLLSLWGKLVAKDRTVFIDDIKLISSGQKKIFFFVHNRAVDRICNGAEAFRDTKKRQWNWMRGLWGSCGSLYIPKTGHYLLLRSPHDEQHVAEITELLEAENLKYSVRDKGNGIEITMRDHGQIVDFMGWMGFSNIVLALEDRSVLRETANNRNRVLNCDMANIEKTVQTAAKQLQVIEMLENSGLFETMPAQLKELALARKNNPEATLTELGKNLLRPIGKSTVQYRWKKIYHFAIQSVRGDGRHELGQGGF